MVQAIVNQRDMYRTLLAQATPLPGDQQSFSSPSRGTGGPPGGRDRERMDSTHTSEAMGDVREEEARRELEEVREQFEVYKKEKMKNDGILQEQLEKMRDESSEIKIHNVKLGSKVRK